ncbi:MAG TPA: acetyl-CoA hydrolase/transferase C-terminal domain-containing protein [Anaerovoracaceae bacterium]|nr:acetyl-CoA hydrolase/transferase C-terminal domain-containing protein [Anaerovoracaceae bacterium]
MQLTMEFRKKLVDAAVAVKAVRSGDFVDYGFAAGFPELLDRSLAARKDELEDVKVRGGLVIRPRIEVVEGDQEKKAFTYYSWHIGDYERKLQGRGLCTFVPSILRLLPYYYRNHLKTDVAFVPVSAPDENGYMGLGISNYLWRVIMRQARTVVFEINEHYPALHGLDGSHRVHVSEADYLVEGGHEPLPERVYGEPSENDKRIAANVVAMIPDGAVLSLGVGGVPYAAACMIADSDLKDIGCHTGTISDAFLKLHKAGKLTNARKEIDRGRSAWNLAMGTQELYDWLKAEPELFRPDCVDYVHAPERIGEMRNVVSINGGVEIDLLGQENAESAPGRQLSGTGGQLDFLEGAVRSEGGKGFICLNAARTLKDGTLKSNIVSDIAPGATVSAPRSLVQYVATEYGVAKLTGLPVRERAEALIAVAHPSFREKLTQQAKEIGLFGGK